MKLVYTSLLASLFITGTANAQQSAAAEAAEDAAEAVAAEVQAQNAAPAPPPIQVVPAPPVLEIAEQNPYPRAPRPTTWRIRNGSPADYPPEAWVAGDEGVVRFSLAIDEQGGASNCQIVESSGSASLDAKTCEIMLERTEFMPALDKDGEPFADTYKGEQRWRKQEPEFPGTSAIEVTFDVSETGETSNCQVAEMSGSISQRTRDQLERRPCPFGSRNGRNIYRDENGVPIPKTVSFRVEVTVEDPE